MTNVIPLHAMIRIHIELVGSDPLIWREMDIRADTALDRANFAILTAMGWENNHLSMFRTDNPYAYPHGQNQEPAVEWLDQDSLVEIGGDNSKRLDGTSLVSALHRAGDALYLVYDFAEAWVHRITVIETRDADPGESPFRVVDGQLRAPLEDSGGMCGWTEKLAIYRKHQKSPDSLDDEESSTVDWMLGRQSPWTEFNPDVFDINLANRLLSAWETGFMGTSNVARWVHNLGDENRQALGVQVVEAGLSLEARGVEDHEMFRCFDPLQVLLRLCNDGGVKLTQAGWLPPKLIMQLCDEAKLHGIDFESPSNKRENNMVNIHLLHEGLVELGLLRHLGGKIVTTKAGALAAKSPAATANAVAAAFGDRIKPDVVKDSTYCILLAHVSRGIDDKTRRLIMPGELMGQLNYASPRTNWYMGDDDEVYPHSLWHFMQNYVRFSSENTAEADAKLTQIARFILES